MKFKLLWCVVFLIPIYAEEAHKSNENNISLEIISLNKQINIDGIDTWKLRLKYKDIFENIKQLKLQGKISTVSSIYIGLAEGISKIKLHNMSALIKREILDNILVDEIEKTLDLNIFTQKIQIELFLGLEKNLLLTKVPLLIAIQNDGKDIMVMAKKNLLKKDLTDKELKLGIYLYDYSYEIIKKYTLIQLDAIKSGSFIKLDEFLIEQNKKYMQKNLNDKNIQLNNKDKLKFKAEILVYLLMSNNLQKKYNIYMSHILRNKQFLEKI